MIYALDTDIFSHLTQGHLQVVTRYRAVVVGGQDSIGIPAVVRAELLRGRFDAMTKAADGKSFEAAYDLLSRTERALAPLPILPVTPQAATTFDHLLKIKKLASRNRADLLIACIVLAHRATLVTGNGKHFAHIPGLGIEDWTT